MREIRPKKAWYYVQDLLFPMANDQVLLQTKKQGTLCCLVMPEQRMWTEDDFDLNRTTIFDAL